MGLGLGLGLGVGVMRRAGEAVPAAPIVVEDQAMTFGALTLEGAGGIAPTATRTIASATIDSGDTSGHWQIASDGTLSPSAVGAGALSGPYTLDCTLTDSSGNTATPTLTVTAEADTYSIADETELAAVIALGVATVSGKTVKGRGGDYGWINTTLNNRAFTALTTLASHDNANRLRFVLDRSIHVGELRAPTNLRWYQIDLYIPFDPDNAAHNANGAGCTLKDNINNFIVDDCDLYSNLKELVVARGYPSVDWTWRGLFGMEGNTRVTGLYRIANSRVHGCRRLLNVPGGPSSTFEFERNEVYDVGVDGMVVSMQQNNLKVNFNDFHSPLIGSAGRFTVSSVDVAANRMTTSEAHGWVGSVVINILPQTAQIPGGLAAMTDYTCTVIDSNTVEFPQDITDEGSGVVIWQEPDHGDWIQFIPTAPVTNFEILGNCLLAARSDDIPTDDNHQGIFMEDINVDDTDASHYENGVIGGNLIYTRSAHGISLYNAINCKIIGNTAVGPAGAESLPMVKIAKHYPSGTGHSNLIADNIAADVAANVDVVTTIQNNIEVLQADYAAHFAGASFAPTTIAQLRAAFAIKAGGAADVASPKIGAAGSGYVDYDAYTFEHPSELWTPPASGFTAVTFDGVSDYTVKSGGLDGAVDGPTGTFAAKFSVDGGDGTFRKILGSSGGRVAAVVTSADAFRFTVADATGTTLFQVLSSVAHGEHEAMISYNLIGASPVVQYWLDGVDQGSPGTVVAGDADVTTSSWSAGGESNGISLHNGSLSYAYFDDAYVDLSVEANRDKFLAASIGANGEGPTGSAPLVYLTGNAAAWNDAAGLNLGTGGAFVMSGAVVDA